MQNSTIAHAVTSGPLNHFFGYYGMQPWDVTGKYLLALEVQSQEHPPLPDEKAVVGMVETSNDKFIPLSQTSTWNFQQGAMMHWLPNSSGSEIIFNDRVEDRVVSVILNVHTLERRILGRAIAALSHDGKSALGLNFGRLAWTRPGYGYAGVPDPFLHEAQPSDDGIYLIDVETGDERRIVALSDILALKNRPHDLGKHPLFFIHPMFNANDQRFAFFVEYIHHPLPKFWRFRLRTGMFTVGKDGEDLRCVIDYGKVSHFDWRNSNEILVWAKIQDKECFHLITDGTGEDRQISPSLLTEDGHGSFSPDGKWVLVDTYPNEERFSTLKLYNWADGDQIILGKFYADPKFVGEIRCDLHPRWNRNGMEVCFDSVHERIRQVYVLDVSKTQKY
jgi:hypothetical protein